MMAILARTGNIQMERGEFQNLSIVATNNREYPDDILVDDAYFLQGEISGAT